MIDRGSFSSGHFERPVCQTPAVLGNRLIPELFDWCLYNVAAEESPGGWGIFS